MKNISLMGWVLIIVALVILAKGFNVGTLFGNLF